MSKRERLYYVETDYGCGIRAARSITQARADLHREVGQQAKSVRRATVGDVAWVQQMGGRVPTGTFVMDNDDEG